MTVLLLILRLRFKKQKLSEILRISEYHMIFHGDLNYQGHGDLKSDLQPSFRLKQQSICYTTQLKIKKDL